MAVKLGPPLLLLAIGLAVYDFRSKRVPNWVSLPLILAGLLLRFPGALETWLACVLLFSAWRCGALGGGDAKLWMAFLWLPPVKLAQTSVLVMAVTLLLTALGQVLWRWVCKRPLLGIRSPGAWRAIPYALWLLAVGV